MLWRSSCTAHRKVSVPCWRQPILSGLHGGRLAV
nr:MAG TPA: Protein of unknown function (DUF3767) [Caudoviricetes sp.]